MFKMKNIKRILCSIMLVILLCSMSVFANVLQDENAGNLTVTKILGTAYSPVKSEVAYVTPENGINLETAKTIISDYVVENPIYMFDMENLKEITTKEFWENTKTQIYAEMKSSECIILVKDNKITEVINDVGAVYIADINNDMKYEVCVSVIYGSGRFLTALSVFDIANSEYYRRDTVNSHLVLDIDSESGKLIVYTNIVSISKENEILADTPIGELIIADGVLTTTNILAAITKDTLPFAIDKISLLQNGSDISAIPNNDTKFLVMIYISKYKKRVGDEYVALAAYDENGSLLKLYYEKDAFDLDGEFLYGFYVEPTELSKPVKSLKAFVLDDFTTLEPLAKAAEFQ